MAQTPPSTCQKLVLTISWILDIWKTTPQGIERKWFHFWTPGDILSYQKNPFLIHQGLVSLEPQDLAQILLHT